MIVVIDKDNRNEHRAALDQAYCLRHRIFVEEAGWEALRSPDGRERDRFDDEYAVEMLLYVGERLIGYQRMLPTTRPHLLTDIYPQLCDGESPRGPNVYEWTRFAVDPVYRGDGTGLGLAGAELVLAYVEWGLTKGVDSVVVELAPSQMMKFVQCHFLPHPLGVVQTIDGRDTIALQAYFDERTRDRLRQIVRQFDRRSEYTLKDLS